MEKYLASGKKDRSCYKESKVVSFENVFDLYDSWGCEPKFYAGHFDEDFDLNYSKEVGPTKQDYIQYLQDFDDEMPAELRKKKETG